MFALGAAAYGGGGWLLNNKTKGLTGKEALPQLEFWLEVYGLVQDGLLFAQSRATGRGGGGKAGPGSLRKILQPPADIGSGGGGKVSKEKVSKEKEKRDESRKSAKKPATEKKASKKDAKQPRGVDTVPEVMVAAEGREWQPTRSALQQGALVHASNIDCPPT